MVNNYNPKILDTWETPEEVMVNNYNPKILDTWETNIDIQYTLYNGPVRLYHVHNQLHADI
jgi:hypothetical protein